MNFENSLFSELFLVHTERTDGLHGKPVFAVRTENAICQLSASEKGQKRSQNENWTQFQKSGICIQFIIAFCGKSKRKQFEIYRNTV